MVSASNEERRKNRELTKKLIRCLLSGSASYSAHDKLLKMQLHSKLSMEMSNFVCIRIHVQLMQLISLNLQ